MADIIGLAAGAAGGGVSGPIGTVTGRIAGLFERRQENAQEQARWKHEAALLEIQIKARASEPGGSRKASRSRRAPGQGSRPPRRQKRPSETAGDGAMQSGR